MLGGFVGCGGAHAGGVLSGIAGLRRGHGQRLALGPVRENQAALEGVRRQRQVGLAAEGGAIIQVQHKVVREAGCEDQRRTFQRQHHGRLQQAGDVRGVLQAQWRRDGGLNRRQSDDDDGLGIVEGGRCVQAQVQRLAVGEGNGRDVLELRGMQA